VARVATSEVEGDRLLVRNVRNFAWRSETDRDERWEDRSFDLDAIDGLDIFFCHWSSPHIAHTILSWSFEDGRHLAVSIETRKSKDQRYSAIAGFFRQYELIYVVGDERDLIGVRANVRAQEIYLYRLKVSRRAARTLLLNYADAMNALAREPRWYNALTTNCTTAARQRVMHAGGRVPLSWKLWANGHLPELLYERGSLDTSRPFAELKATSRVDERARAAGTAEDFSARLRAALPMEPTPEGSPPRAGSPA
jgi:hypothetical protein